MDFELQPVTDVGRRFVALCHDHEQAFFARAAHYDCEGSFPEENYAELVRSGVMAATVPAELGGAGVSSMRDFIAGMNRLGRADGSTSIAANMHLFLVWQSARIWRAARIAGDGVAEFSSAAFLREVVAGRLITAVLATENGTGLVNPLTEAIRDGNGWRLNGQKSFATGCSAAHILNVMVQAKDAEGNIRRAAAQVKHDNPGMEIRGNWDALGMRGSGSHDVIFKDCYVPNEALKDTGPWGEVTPGFLTSSTVANLGLAAEAARAIVLQLIASRGQNGRSSLQNLIGEMEIDLAAARAILERSAANTDALLDAHPEAIPADLARSMAKDFHCAKRFVTKTAIGIVDHALTASGGLGYLSKSPLVEFIGKISLGVTI